MTDLQNTEETYNLESQRPFSVAVYFLLAIGLVLSFLQTGISVGGGDHPIHLTYVYKVLNPELYNNDPFVDTVEQYPSIFWGAIAAVAKVGVPLTPLIIAVQIFFRALCLVGIFLLAFEIASHSLTKLNPSQLRYTALGSAFLFLALNTVHWGGTFMLEGTLETSTASFSPLPFCWYFWLRRNWLGWALAFAVAAWLHPMIGLYFGFMFFLMWLVEGDLYLPTTDEGKSFWFKGGIPSVFLAGSAFVFALLKSPEPMESFEAWAAIAEYRFPHHFYPATWSRVRFTIWGIIAYVCYISIVGLLRGRRLRLFLAGFVAVFVLVIIGTLAPLYYPKPLLISLCLWRSPITWTSAAYCVFIPFAINLLFHEQKRAWLPAAFVLAGLIALIGITIKSINTRSQYAEDEDRKALMSWIKENSEPDDVILAPLLLSGTRLETERNVYVEWKDGAAHLWNPDYTENIWVSRLTKITGTQRTTPNGLPRPSTYSEARADYKNLINDPERLMKLCKDEGIDWVVVEGELSDSLAISSDTTIETLGNWTAFQIKY